MHAASNCPFYHPQKHSMKFQIGNRGGIDALPSNHFPIFPTINSKRLSSSKINELPHPHLNRIFKKFHRYMYAQNLNLKIDRMRNLNWI